MKKFLFVLMCIGFLCEIVYAISPPAPAKSKYFVSTRAGFIFNLSKPLKVQYAISLKPKKKIEENLYLKAIFDNFENHDKPIIILKIVNPEDEEIDFKSQELLGVNNATLYNVEIKVYKDEAMTELLDVHKQKILFYITKEIWKMVH